MLAWRVDATGGWNAPLLVLAGIYAVAVAAIAWLMINPEQRVERLP